MKNTLLFVMIFIINLISQPQIFDKELFKTNRQKVFDQIKDGVLILKGETVKNRNSDIDYEFRQSSNFHYLTGFDEPDAICILDPKGINKFILFHKETSLISQIYSGHKKTNDELKEFYGADEIFDISKFDEILKDIVKQTKAIYFSKTKEDNFNKVVMTLIENNANNCEEINETSTIFNELRLIKSDKEIELIKKAVNITIEAQQEIMKATKPGIYENELVGIIKYIFHKNGAKRSGFNEIVSSGDNLPILHYEDNNNLIKENSLIMADIGAEFGYYSADLTRTFPVNGIFSEKEKEIYNAVLNVLDTFISNAGTHITNTELNSLQLEVYKKELLKLGLITDSNSNWQWRLYMIYGAGFHWLGLDTHDVGNINKNSGGRKFEKGMVLAIEPAIYVDKNLLNRLPQYLQAFRIKISDNEINDFILKVKPAFDKYAGICIRIEDNIVITENGAENISKNLARTIDEIESLMKQKSIFK